MGGCCCSKPVTDTADSRFPAHWGPPPEKQLKDLRELPGGYGQGSSTLATWIATHMAADEASGTSGETPGVCTESDLGSDPGTKLERARQARRHEKTQAQAQAQAGGTSGVDGVSGAGGTSGLGGSGLAAGAATTAAGAAAAGASGMGDDDEPMTDARRKEEAAFKRQQRDELAKRAFDAITGSTGTATLAAIKKQIGAFAPKDKFSDFNVSHRAVHYTALPLFNTHSSRAGNLQLP